MLPFDFLRPEASGIIAAGTEFVVRLQPSSPGLIPRRRGHTSAEGLPARVRLVTSLRILAGQKM